MRNIYKISSLFFLIVLFAVPCHAQIKIIEESNAQKLVQKLLGPGVTVSNVSTTASSLATGFFFNTQGTQIGLDSGIVLSNGRVKTNPITHRFGMDGDKITPAYTGDPDASSSGAFASTILTFPGDADLQTLLSSNLETNDATVLEFKFIPLGDTIKFRYVFSSEEYPTYPCQAVNDAFAFFIQGAGFPTKTNIALIPGSTDPVTIDNIQDIGACSVGAPYYPQYYISNQTNTAFTHNGHTTVFTAVAKVVPCTEYSLKLVIADVGVIGSGDAIYDSGVFLEAGSLTSNAVKMENLTQVDALGNSYLVEGCATGAFKIKRPQAQAIALPVTLFYGGTFTNGVDAQPLPILATIPANQQEVTINILPIIDNVPEGIETIKIYAIAGCASGLPTDSVTIQLRDYDILGIVPDTSYICSKNSVQLVASTGYSIYQWDANPTLSATGIRNPAATPVSSETMYYCTGTEGTCHARDSAFVKWKELKLISKKEVNCKDASTGEIIVDGGFAWTAPLYSINNGTYQTQRTFSNLPVGVYKIKIKDTDGCIDSIEVPITQLFPDLLITDIPVTPASCSGAADGTVTINMTGGKVPYLYSSDGINFQSNNVFNFTKGNYTLYIKDQNNCTASQNVFVPLSNTVNLDAGFDPTICEGKSAQLNAVTNAAGLVWWPITALSDPSIKNPLASPVVTTKYYTLATTGICTQLDSVTVIVNPAPIPNAGPDSTICFGQDIKLKGTGGVSYSWKPSSYLSNDHIAEPVAQQLPGNITYYLYTIDANGCTSLKRDTIKITVTRPAVLNAGRDTSIAVNLPLQLSAIDVNHIGFTSYLWSPSYGLDDANIANPVAILDRDVTYLVTAHTPNGCEGKDFVVIKAYKGPEIYVPNAFTPNNDSKNDVLRAIPIGMKEFRYFRIYNRWGQMVFSTNDGAKGWDGRLNGKEQDIMTFVWYAEAVDYKGNVVQRKGTVTILR